MTARRRFHVDGIVQGVGFRPFVFNLAESLGLAGWVNNSSAGVFVEVEGEAAALDAFARRLESEAPPLSRIVGVHAEPVEPLGESEFEIRASDDTPGTATLIPVDTATCADCLRELRDPADRRHGYAFINCTHCGPRWTIIERIPYDRPFTSMAPFTLCGRCRAEYDDPRDRRFHAQPNACPDCGPRLRLVGAAFDADDPALDTAAALLVSGGILALKGLGGYHLAVRADDQDAVLTLRERKGREAKPLALMAADLEAVRFLCHVDDHEAALLTSPQAPIVLLNRIDAAGIAPAVAPGHRRLGVMLPYTPVHHLLMDAVGRSGLRYLVMTSGNLSDEPICLDNDDARDRLAEIADAWLLHDRGIVRRADDSVVQSLAGRTLHLRRSRGYAPVPILLRGALAAGEPVLGTGPLLKNTVCLLKEDRAFLSPHIGDLESLRAFDFFRETVATLQDVLECTPRIVAHDLHPAYLSTRWARERHDRDGVRLIGVQHHHAHLAAVHAEHGLAGPALGLILDGTGYGEDGTIWGGELLLGDAAGYERLGWLEPVRLPGGDAAVRAPWRTALACLHRGWGADFPMPPFLADKPVGAVLTQLERALNAPLTSSCGRLFDAVAALTGRWDTVDYEAQAAIEFTALTDPGAVERAEPLAWAVDADAGRLLMRTAPLIEDAVAALRDGATAGQLSARFHRTLIDLFTETIVRAAEATGVTDVVLAGGSLQNEILATLLPRALAARGLRPRLPIDLPANDGAVSFGQVVVARARLDG